MHLPRIAVIVIRRSNGDLFVHQRLASKRLFPGLFGLGAGGHMTPSESPAAAAERELLEETGIEAAIFPLFELEYQGQGVQHVVHVFESVSEAEPAHDFGEWQWSGWLPPAQVRELAEQRKLCPDTALVFARYSQRDG